MKVSYLYKIVCITLIGVVLFCNCTSPTAGTTDTGNARIAAVIFSNNGNRAAGVKVTISPAEYISSIGKDSNVTRLDQIKEMITNEDGYFDIVMLNAGNYVIEVNDGDSCAALMPVTVSLSNKSNLIVLVDTIRQYATVRGNAGRILNPLNKRYLVIYGLDRKVPVSSDGSFIVDDLPEGTFHMRIISENDSVAPVDINNVKTVSSDSVTLPYAGWHDSANIILNTTLTGANVSGNVLRFPVLVRLSGSNFNFSQAKVDGSDCRFVKPNNQTLPFDIEQWDSLNNKASIWVLMDTVYGNSLQSITMYWGNPNALPASRSSKVFDTANGFMGGYHFNRNILDATANNYDGIDSSSYDSPDGIIGRARAFDGINSYISLGDLPDRSSGTISFWFKPAKAVDSSTNFSMGIWGKKSNDSMNSHIILRGKDYVTDSLSGIVGTMVSKIENPINGNYLECKTNSFTAGIWYHAVWSWGYDCNNIYINGILESSTPYSRPVSNNADDEIGRSLFDGGNIYLGAPRYFYGLLDEFRIDKTIRDEFWIKLSFMNQCGVDKLVGIVKR